MPLIEVTIVEGRTDPQIKDLITALTEDTARILGSKKDVIRVIVREVPASRWAAGGVTIAEQRAAARAAGSG